MTVDTKPSLSEQLRTAFILMAVMVVGGTIIFQIGDWWAL